jgi:aryl-alcohol dehydrogenase-like predicted oxidoreductase
MQYRCFPRFDWRISEVGFGMWGMGGWTGSDDEQSGQTLDRAVALGCTFFDTAWAYGDGRSERLLGALLRRHAGKLYVATKVPPKNRRWPGRAIDRADEVFPYEHVMEYARLSLASLGVPAIDLLQLHVWDDSWTAAQGWLRAVDELKRHGLISAFGISVNRWAPQNVLRALDTGVVDTVQVVYNVFDQSAEDVLFPACERLRVGVIARVPFDEGSLTGTLRPGMSWPEGDFRNSYFTPPHLAETLRRVDPLQSLAAEWALPLPALALRFILTNPVVTTTIPGMRRARHAEENMGASDAPRLSPAQIAALRAFRWDRQPDERS